MGKQLCLGCGEKYGEIGNYCQECKEFHEAVELDMMANWMEESL